MRRATAWAIMAAALASPLIGACGLIGGDGTPWVVSAAMRSAEDADDACGNLPGIGEKGWSSTSDLPPGAIAEGVYWTVASRPQADAVAACLRSFGAVEVAVGEQSEPKSFHPTGP